MAGLDDDESAVADVVGNFLLIGITVAMVAVVAFFIASQPPPDNPVNADLTVRSGGNELFIEHTWGEPVQLEGGRLLVVVDGDTEIWELDDHVNLTSRTKTTIADPPLRDSWELNERLCIFSSPADPSDCLYTGSENIERVGIVMENKLVVDWSRSVTT